MTTVLMSEKRRGDSHSPVRVTARRKSVSSPSSSIKARLLPLSCWGVMLRIAEFATTTITPRMRIGSPSTSEFAARETESAVVAHRMASTAGVKGARRFRLSSLWISIPSRRSVGSRNVSSRSESASRPRSLPDAAGAAGAVTLGGGRV